MFLWNNAPHHHLYTIGAGGSRRGGGQRNVRVRGGDPWRKHVTVDELKYTDRRGRGDWKAVG